MRRIGSTVMAVVAATILIGGHAATVEAARPAGAGPGSTVVLGETTKVVPSRFKAAFFKGENPDVDGCAVVAQLWFATVPGAIGYDWSVTDNGATVSGHAPPMGPSPAPAKNVGVVDLAGMGSIPLCAAPGDAIAFYEARFAGPTKVIARLPSGLGFIAGSVSGRTCGAEDTGSADLRTVIATRNGKTYTATTIKGRYLLAVPPGTYSVRVKESTASPKTVTARKDATVTADFSERPCFTVSGRATSVSCDEQTCRTTDLEGVRIVATGTETRSTVTAADGRWSLRLKKGTWTVTPAMQDRTFQPGRRRVIVDATDVGGVDFRSCALGTTGTATAGATACELKVDWQVPKRYRSDDASYYAGDGVLNRRWATPDKWKVKLYIRSGSAARADCSGYRFHWTITPKQGGPTRSITGPSDRCALDTTVPREGTYRVTVQEERKKAGSWRLTGRHGVQTVVIQDWLIIAMGDSFASGEGNPDIPGNRSPRWQFAQCHRSFDSWQARVAGRIEVADDHTSVTFLHTGCSGASIRHLLDRSYAGIETGPLLPPQIGQLRKRLDGADREVDAILLSIGVNDLLFGPVIKLCAYPGTVCHERRVREKTVNGDPVLVEDPASGTTLAQFETSRVSDLAGRYAALQASLSGVDADRVFIPGYPDLARDGQGDICTPSQNPVDWKAIARSEAAWIMDTGDALNAVIRGVPGWRYISSHLSSFRRHGWCAPDSWIQTIKGSFHRQGNKEGAMHPVGMGPQVIADAVSDAVCNILYQNADGSCRFDPVTGRHGIRPPATGNRLDG